MCFIAYLAPVRLCDTKSTAPKHPSPRWLSIYAGGDMGDGRGGEGEEGGVGMAGGEGVVVNDVIRVS